MYTRVEDDHAYVAREACILLACLLSSATDEGDDMLAPGGSAVIPVAVFDALAGVLRWSTGDFSSGQDSEEEAGTMVSQVLGSDFENDSHPRHYVVNNSRNKRKLY